MVPLGVSLFGIGLALLFAAWSAKRARCERRDVVCLGIAAGAMALPGAALLAL